MVQFSHHTNSSSYT